MPDLASNQRTATPATIRRASAAARRSMNVLDRQALARLEGIYKAAVKDVQLRIHAYGDVSGTLRLEVMRDMLSQINARLDELTEARNTLLNNNLDGAALIGIKPFQDHAALVSADSFNQVAYDAVNFVRSFADSNGVQLSDRLWRLDNNARDMVTRHIESAVIQGHSSSQAAREFLSRGQAVPGSHQVAINNANAINVARTFGRELMKGEMNPYAQARRLFRTEINRAHGEAYMAGAETHPDVVGFKYLLSPNHPRPDICDMHSAVNLYGLGAGVYPTREQCPWPAHPNILSYVVVVFADEVSEADGKGRTSRIEWLNKQPPHIQEGVLGARKKRVLLQQGLLKQNEIATPWKVLKKRYERRGIDTDKLFIKPTASAPALIGSDRISELQYEARQYVLNKGEATGWEHLVAFDVNTGNEFMRHTSRKPREVKFDRHQMAMLQSPGNRLEITHNHPSSSSLSIPDLRVSTLPGVSRIVAVGHDGTTYASVATAGVSSLVNASSIIEREIFNNINRKVQRNEISTNAAQIMHSHIRNLSLDKLGMIEYKAFNTSTNFNKWRHEFGSDEIENIANKARDKAIKELQL